jgi:hypothetical protein
MKIIKHIWFYIGLIGASGLFLLLEHWIHWEFFWHLAAIPLEILMAVFIVEKFLESREAKEKRRQLMYIKSYMFRSEMRSLFIADFAALKTPPVTMRIIRNATLEELGDMRRRAETIEYASLEAMEPVIDEYVRAERVWHEFKERAITYNFENIFLDMIYILHFIYDVKLFKERNPVKLFILEAAKRDELMAKTRKVLTDGIKRFLEYAIELKESRPEMFDEMMVDYETSIHLRETA